MAGIAPSLGWTLDAQGDNLLLVGEGKAHRLRDRERSLYAALVAMAGLRDLEPEDLACMQSWAGLTAPARGKLISRMRLGKTRPHGRCIVSPPKGKTKFWSLADNVGVTAAARELGSQIWLSAERAFQTHADLTNAEVAEWMASEASTLMHITSAKVADADRENLAGLTIVGESPDLKTISDFVDSRVRQLRGKPFLGYRRDESGTRIATEVSYRMLALEALAGGDQQRKDHLRRVRVALAASLDLTTRAWLNNAICVLLRREGDLAGSVAAGRTAAPLAILSNDFVLIQAAAFNLALALAMLAKTAPEEADGDSIYKLLEIDRSFRRFFNLGRNSAQCELGLAAWHMRKGNWERADEVLVEAEALVRFDHPSIDRALYWRRRAEFAVRSGRAIDRATVDEWLARAERDYRTIDRLAGLEAVKIVRVELEEGKAKATRNRRD